MGDDFYIRLARQIRRGNELRTATAARENPVLLARGGVALDVLLNHLDSGAQEPLIDQLQREVQKALIETQAKTRSPYAVFVEKDALPKDPFLAHLVEFFDGYDGGFSGDVPRELVARAVIDAFASTTAGGGIALAEDVRKHLGERAAQVLEQLTKAVEKAGPSPTLRPALKYDGLAPMVADRIARSRPAQTFSARMPLLAETAAKLGGGGGALAGFELASVQHLFPTTGALFDSLVGAGVVVATSGVGGKNYSSHPDVTARLQADGFDVAWEGKPRPEYGALNSEEEIYSMAVHELRALFAGVDPARSDKKFLLLDEGGKLIKALHLEFPEYAHLCVAVEQTERGGLVMDELQRQGVQLLCPVIEMGRSEIKKRVEAPAIGESVAFHTDFELARVDLGLRLENQQPKIATVIGYGAVGKAVADSLRARGFEVYVYDIDPKKMQQAAAEGCHAVPREEALRHAHLLVGCTGVTSVRRADWDLLPNGAKLVNAGSGNHELDLHELKDDFFAKADRTARQCEDGMVRSSFCGREVVVGDGLGNPALYNRVLRSKSGKELLAVRSGYVVNMTLGLPPEYAQLTLAMLLASCLQAAKSKTKGRQPLDPKVQQWLEQRADELVKARGLQLMKPDFRKLESWRV